MLSVKEGLGFIIPERAAVKAIAGVLAVSGLFVAMDKAEDVLDRLTPDLDWPTEFENPPATLEVDDTRAVWEAISSHIVHKKTERVENLVISYDNPDQEWVPSFLAGSRLPEKAIAGTVTAEVDFSKTVESGIRPTEDGRSLSILLPGAEHSATEIDEGTKFELQAGFFNKVIGAIETEEEVRAKAKQAMTDAALKRGLLASTERDAEESMRGFVAAILASKGFAINPDDIKIEFAGSEEQVSGQEQEERVKILNSEQ